MVDQLLLKTATLESQQRKIERLNRTLSTLSAVNALIVRAQDRQGLLEDACRIAVETGGFGCAAIGLVEKGSQALRIAAFAGEDALGTELPSEARLSVCNDLEGDPRGFLSSAVLPLASSGETVGVLLLYARQRDFFDEEEMRLLGELANDVSFALHHLAQKARMDYLAYYDSLTDLPNRSLFTDRMSQALSAARREKRFAAAVFLDIERFRMVNETFGRKAGDELIRQVAARLARAARDEDTVARIGADHFAVAVAPFDQPGD